MIAMPGATNRPQDIDEAVRRRLVKRIYIPLPSAATRGQVIAKLLKDQKHSLKQDEFNEIVRETEGTFVLNCAHMKMLICFVFPGYSASDLTSLCREAALIPVRELGSSVLR